MALIYDTKILRTPSKEWTGTLEELEELVKRHEQKDN